MTLLISVPSYVKALKESGLKERATMDYVNCLASKLYNIEGDKVLFRKDCWEFAFCRKNLNEIKFLYVTYVE